MVSAARAQGRPTMVIAMITAASSQPSAIQTPPVKSHRTLRTKLMSGIDGASDAEIAELAAQLVLSGGDVGLHPREPRLEVAELELQRIEAAVGRQRHLAPQALLRAGGIEVAGPLRQDRAE